MIGHQGSRRHRQDVVGDVMALSDAAQRYLAGQTRGRLATIGPDGTPQNKPVGFTYNGELGTIDIAGFNMDTSAKYRNVGIDPNVAFVVDDAVSEGAAGMRFVEVRGQAEQVSVEPSPGLGLSPHIIRIHPRRVISMNIDPDDSGLQTLDVGTIPDGFKVVRPSLGRNGGAAQRANQAVADFVDELQAGWDEHDADLTNRHFANDIVWGSPFGVTLQGYEQLHAVHVRLKQQAREAPRRASRSCRFSRWPPTSPSPMSGASRLVTTAPRRRRAPTSRVRSRRWPSTCWCVAIERGGLPPGRTPLFVPHLVNRRPARADKSQRTASRRAKLANTGARTDRAERVPAWRRPLNLIRVMPAKGGAHHDR